jgi:MFS family permease
MAIRSWLKLLATTTTAAAAVGAGQLGIAYGLGMVRLDQTLEITQRDQWTAQLAWVAWIAMTAAALGAVVATGLRPRWSPRPVGIGGALGMGLAAGIGALAVLPLTMQPARAAQVTGVQPVLVIGICAALGAAAGIFAGWAAAARAVVRWSLATLTIAVWTVALISVTPSLLPGKTPDAVRLGVLEGDLIPAAVIERTQFATMPTIAMIAGLIIGWIARGRKLPTMTVALSGLAGPALLTVAYLISGPGSTSGFALSPYWAAMTASGAGVLGSVLAAIVRGAPEPAEDPDAPSGDTPAEGQPGSGSASTSASASSASAASSADSRPTLPRRDAPVQSAIAQAAAAAAQRPDHQLRPSDTGVFSVAVADRPYPLQELAPAAAPGGSPFTAGTGSPFGQTTPPAPAVYGHAAVQAPPAPHPTGPGAPGNASLGAPGAPGAPGADDDSGRFSGQQPKGVVSGLRRGWRTRKAAPEAPAAAPSPALTSDTGSFNGFTAPQPGTRAGTDTAAAGRPRAAARAPLTPEPTPISAPLPHPQPIAPPPSAPDPRGRRDHKDEDYSDWLNGLGKA